MIHFIDRRGDKFYLFDQHGEGVAVCSTHEEALLAISQHGATSDILLTSELTQSDEGKALMADMGIDLRKVEGYEEQQGTLL